MVTGVTSLHPAPAVVALNEYIKTCENLAGLHIERGQVRAAVILQRSAAYAELAAQGLNVTTCREGADFAVAELNAETVKLDGEIDAANATLRWLDQWIAHLKTDTPSNQHA